MGGVAADTGEVAGTVIVIVGGVVLLLLLLLLPLLLVVVVMWPAMVIMVQMAVAALPRHQFLCEWGLVSALAKGKKIRINYLSTTTDT